MKLYACDRQKWVRAATAIAAARVFAERIARRELGRRSFCVSVRFVEMTKAGHLFAAQIGRDNQKGARFRDVSLLVYQPIK